MTLLIRVFSTVALIGLAYNAVASPILNGLAVHNQLAEDQFIAAVYSESTTGDARALILADEDKAMELRVLTDTLYSRRFKRMWIEGIAINAGTTDLQKHAQHLADFSNLLKFNLAAGDILRIERETDTATVLSLNGVTLGRIDDDQFFDLLLRTWVGPVPLSSQFKQNLLAAGKVSAELQQRFARIEPTPARVTEITAAVAALDQPGAPADASAQEPTQTTTTEVPPAMAESEVAAATEEPAVTTKPTLPEPEAAEESGLESEASLFADETLFAEEEDFDFTAEQVLIEQVYISKLTKWTSSFVSYPRAALKSNKQGTVRLTVTLRRNGKVKDVRFLEKSEHEELNRAAAKAVRSASPYPKVPDAIKGDTFIFTVPVVFLLQ